MNINNLKLAGYFTVDSGMAMVGDPCYLDDWQTWNDNSEPFENYEKVSGEYSYLGASGITIKNSFGELGNAKSVVFNTGYGDGMYPVYVQVNADNRVSKVIIDFEDDIYLDGEEQ